MKIFAVAVCGATAIEYALIAGLISLVIVSSVKLIGSNLSIFFTSLAANVK